MLYLFGTPGQERFWFMWDELAIGALGAVVLADTRRLADCFAAIDYFEHRGMPFVVAVNCFDGAPRYEPDDVRIALDLDPEVPIVLCDARERDSVKQVLISPGQVRDEPEQAAGPDEPRLRSRGLAPPRTWRAAPLGRTGADGTLEIHAYSHR